VFSETVNSDVGIIQITHGAQINDSGGGPDLANGGDGVLLRCSVQQADDATPISCAALQTNPSISNRTIIIIDDGAGPYGALTVNWVGNTQWVSQSTYAYVDPGVDTTVRIEAGRWGSLATSSIAYCDSVIKIEY